jgi:hypothetical protein
MGELRCVDGSVLSVEAVSCRDRAGQPYEITLNLTRNAVLFAAVGQRCGYQLSQLADRLSAARRDPVQAAEWPDPDDRFPVPAANGAGPAASDEPAGSIPGAAGIGQPVGYLPGDAEYFALRSRDRVDPPGSGELRCVLRSHAVWLGECAGVGRHPAPHPRATEQPAVRPPAAGHGGWRLTRRAVIEAWGTGGVGVRAVLTSAELVAFLDTVLRGQVGVAAAEVPAGRAMDAGDQSAGRQPGGTAMPPWRQRGRVPDGIARSRLPALRAQARGGYVAAVDTQARRGDVRR